MGGKPRLMETAEEEVVEKNGAQKEGENRAKHHLLRKTAAACLALGPLCASLLSATPLWGSTVTLSSPTPVP